MEVSSRNQLTACSCLVCADVVQSRMFPYPEILKFDFASKRLLAKVESQSAHFISFLSPGLPSSFKIKVNSGLPLQRKLPSSLMPPLPLVEAPSNTAKRKIIRIPTCSSHYTSTSTEWRRAAKVEVSLIVFPLQVIVTQITEDLSIFIKVHK